MGEHEIIIKMPNKNKIPITCRGAGTNLIGACHTDCGGIVINFSKMDKILDVSKTDMIAIVQPGVIIGNLQKEVETLRQENATLNQRTAGQGCRRSDSQLSG